MPEKPEGTPPNCKECKIEQEKFYWCEICRQAFDSKRCPLCGLKLKRIK